MYGQVERGWTVSEVRQWAQRTALIGASGLLVLAGFVNMPGTNSDNSDYMMMMTMTIIVRMKGERVCVRSCH